MQPGNSKHAAWVDENLAHDTLPITHGRGIGRSEQWREPVPVTDDEFGTLNGNHWQESDAFEEASDTES